jgi:hypothetical protein
LGHAATDADGLVGRSAGRPDAPALARFYADLLDWQVFNLNQNRATVAPSVDAGHYLAIQAEPKYLRPVWPAVDGQQQIMLHVDIAVDDLAHAVAFAVSVGALLPEHQPQEDVRVLLDPEGYPFCLYLDGGPT